MKYVLTAWFVLCTWIAPIPEQLLSQTSKDTFTDTNGTLLENHTMDVGPGWTKNEGVVEIQSNVADVTTASVSQAGGYFYFDASDSNVVIESDVYYSSGAASVKNVGIVFRLDTGTPDNHFVAALNEADSMRIYRYPFLLLATQPYALDLDTWYTLKVEADDNNLITFTVQKRSDGSGKDTLTVTNSYNSDKTGVGLKTEGLDFRYDDYEVNALSASANVRRRGHHRTQVY